MKAKSVSLFTAIKWTFRALCNPQRYQIVLLLAAAPATAVELAAAVGTDWRTLRLQMRYLRSAGLVYYPRQGYRGARFELAKERVTVTEEAVRINIDGYLISIGRMVEEAAA
jgi:DNA-binding transcriptional ArsR family regulator